MKTAEIKVMVSPEIKAKLKAKADELGLSITNFIEKIANEPICFLDSNVKNLMIVLGKLIPNNR